jgi:antirestriction protein ArdC
MSSLDGFIKNFADNAIAMMEKGKVPWDPGLVGSSMPRNGATGNCYRGCNVLRLLIEQQLRGFTTSDWLTYMQGRDMGGQVRKGEKSTPVVFWMAADKKQKDDATGAADDEDRQRRVVPMFYAVFNRDQIDGLPPMPERAAAGEQWRHEKAEDLLTTSGASISHDGMGRAFYRPATDSIHLPAKDAFISMDRYYATALHELGHWSGHESRLGRDLSGAFGSESYAKEELRAEIASWMIGNRLGVGHDPAQHAAYLKHWVAIVRSDPKEIMRACADAEKICKFLGVEPYEQVLAQKNEQAQVAELPAPPVPTQDAQEVGEPQQVRRSRGRGR